MTVETPERSDASAPITDAVRVKDAGEGASKVKNPFDAFLPSYEQEAWDEQFAAAKAAKAGKAQAKAAAVASGNAAKLIERARAFVGTPYKWGGSGPLGFDCSGFTQYLYRELGINLPRVSNQQGTYGKRVGIDQLRPGDLVFWDNSSRNNGADHVAIYIGNGQVIHAPKPGDRVKISKLWDTGRAWGVAMNL